MDRRATVSREVEKRWELKKLPDGLYRPQKIEQFLILADKQGKLRARKTEVDDYSVFSLTAKQKSSNGSLESTTEIPEETWDWLKNNHMIKGSREVKKRYHWERWVVDEILEGNRKGKIVVEYEISPGEDPQITLPPHFGPGKIAS